MNILEQAKDIYDKCGYSDMTKDLSAYMANGCVYISPNSLLVFKAVKKNCEVRPCNQWNVKDPDAWYVQAVIGKVKDLIKYIPYDLPYIGWERGVKQNSLKWFKFSSLKRRK